MVRKFSKALIKLMEEFGKGFSESTLEKARKFYLTYKNRISETMFTNFEGDLISSKSNDN